MDFLIFGAFILAIVFAGLGLAPPLRGAMLYLFGVAFVCLLIAVGLFMFGRGGGRDGLVVAAWLLA